MAAIAALAASEVLTRGGEDIALLLAEQIGAHQIQLGQRQIVEPLGQPGDQTDRIGIAHGVVAIQRRQTQTHQRCLRLQQQMPGSCQKVLTAQLRELEADGVVQPTPYPEVPPRVEYNLSPLGLELIPVIEGLHAWGSRAQPTP